MTSVNNISHYEREQMARQRQALIDSVRLESARRRLPRSRAGRLLAVVRDLHLAEVKALVKANKGYNPEKDKTRIRIVDNLNERIRRLLEREDHNKQQKLWQ